ncbi:sugar phosphate nucleotidyltransferase [Halobellus inordinatus]|uniref:sugar phosphate nucleotidyltransferase n=1 Tax=Halobellus inordinatus TaxID=1126236 RepID=UPI00211395CA|nr:NDP-sugar synthase [Halobellus ramosii]
MQAIVLAGGYATRLWPVTKERPKMFLPIGEETVIDTVLADLEADARISEVYISTNERFASDFEAYLDAAAYEKATISVEETTAEDEKFGVVGALAQLLEREGIDDDFLVIAGDNLISFDISEFIDHFETHSATTLAAYDVGSTERAKSYGLVELDGDRVVDFQEKPSEPNSTLVSIACYAFPAATIPLFETYLADGENPDEPGWFIQWLQSRDDVYAFTFDGAWFDIGTPESYLDAVEWHLDGETHIAEDATIESAAIGDNVHVMSGAAVGDSIVESSVVFPEKTVTNATIRRSIVDEECQIEDVNLNATLVGGQTQLQGSQSPSE